MTFTYEHIKTQEGVRTHIKDCEGKHTQQAIYSTFHDALTQICFGCQRVRSTIYKDSPSLPQNGDGEKELKRDIFGEICPEDCKGEYHSPSEGKEKEPKHIHEPFLTKWYQGKQYCPSRPSILTITNNADTPSALAEKEPTIEIPLSVAEDIAHSENEPSVQRTEKETAPKTKENE